MRRRGSPLRIVGQGAAGTAIGAACVAMGSGQGLGDLGARAEAGIDQTIRLQPIERLLIKPRPLRLDDRFAIDRQSQPFQILENSGHIFRPAAARIEILDPDQEFPAARPGMGMADHRRKGMAEVQSPRGRRRETCDLQDSLHDKGACGDS